MISAIYARKSTEQAVSDEQKSVARQVDHARQYAARKGWSVAEACIFVDDGISGAEFANRPGFVRLMASLKPRPPFQALIMSEESRLGREAIETAYALKQLVTADVRVFFYLEDRERTLDSPTDKIMLSLTTFADELEREKARQRTYDAMHRKAAAGHVTGGACFGYQNIEIAGPDGRRSHVERQIDAHQADVIRRIFELCAAGHGLKAIAKILNADRALSPRAQRGRSQTWAPSSVREVLFRSVYRGELLWNATRKRDRWGQQRQMARPEHEWMRRAAPHLQIVSNELWEAAHDRLAASRALYLRGTVGQAFGRPVVGVPSPYLLTTMAACGVCGGSMRVRTRKLTGGAERTRFYGCASYHERGAAVCSNRADVPMPDADAVLIEALLDDVLVPDLVVEAVDAAVALVGGSCEAIDARLVAIDAELMKAKEERDRLVTAIATSGGQLGSLIDALRDRESRVMALGSERAAIAGQRRSSAADAARVRVELVDLAADWRRVLTDEPTHGRPIVARLLNGRVQFKPIEPGRWEMRGVGTLAGLFSREIFPSVWRP